MGRESLTTAPDSLFTSQKGLTRAQVIDSIRAHNPGATNDYLDRFETPALSLYLDHLTLASEPRGTIWRRPGDTAAIIRRHPGE